MKRFSEKYYSQLNFPQSARPGNLLARIFAVILGVGAMVLSLVVGAVFIAIVVGFMLLIGLVVAARLWWMRRKMERHAREHGDLEAEYTVIQSDERRR
jgi:Flp pilus assembly protein TadB